MPCTTILVGKKASYDGSTIIARNDDSGSGHYTSKKFAVIHPEEQPKIYKSVISHVEIELPENPMRYTAMPNAEEGEGIWAACGVNEAHVGMTATETITSNPRVLGADPLVRYQPAKDGKEEIPGGIGEVCSLGSTRDSAPNPGVYPLEDTGEVEKQRISSAALHRISCSRVGSLSSVALFRCIFSFGTFFGFIRVYTVVFSDPIISQYCFPSLS